MRKYISFLIILIVVAPSTLGELKLWYTMDSDDIENERLIDLSGNENNALIHGARINPGRIGESLYFNGKTDFIETEFTQSFSQWTISLWLRASNPPGIGESSVIEKYGEYELSWDTKRQNNAYVSSGGVFSRLSDLYPGIWYNLLITNDGMTVKTYINSNLISEKKAPTTSGDYPLIIGRDGIFGIDSKNYFSGQIDDIRIYDNGLDDYERKNLFLMGTHEGDINRDGCLDFYEMADILKRWEKKEIETFSIVREASIYWELGC